MKLIIEAITAFSKMIFILTAAPVMMIGFAIGYFYHALEVGFFFGKLYLSNITTTKKDK